MEQIFPEHWAFLHFGLIFSITCAQLLVVYVLSDSSNPPAGLGLFTAYFMIALLGWIAVTLQQGADTPMTVDIPALATIFNSFILFLAAGERAGNRSGRWILGLVCLAGCLCVFFLSPRQMFVVHSGCAALFFAAVGLHCGWRAWRQRNVGDAIIAYAALMMVAGMPAAIFQLWFRADLEQGQTIALGVHSASFALVAVGFLASVLIEYQQHLSHLATEDPLTRLLNRRGLEDAVQISLAQAARRGEPTSAIMLDIDHFKQVNDSFGQDYGDRVIQQVAGILKRTCRISDVVARAGGEEFLLVLPGTELDQARTLAERVRCAIGDHALLVDGQRIPITVSIGVASTSGEVDLDELFRDADRAMSMAKQAGRNRVASLDSSPVRLSAASRGA